MAALVERTGWPPTVIEEQPVELLAGYEVVGVYKAFDHFHRDPTALSAGEEAIVKPLQRQVERRMLKVKRRKIERKK